MEKNEFNSPIKKQSVGKNKLISLVQPTGKALDAAIQSILPENEKPETSLNVLHIESKKLSPVPSIKSEAGVTQLEIKPANANAQKQLANSSITFTSTPTSKMPRQTFKVIAGNQFIQLKPSPTTTPVASEQKFVTIKSQTATKSGNLVGTSKIYTLKSGLTGSQQLVPVDNKMMQSNFSPTKFTIMKQSTPGNASTTSDSSSTTLSADCSVSDYTNILDMPVVFADNDGNIAQEPTTPTTTTYKTITKSATGSQPQQRTQYIIQTKTGNQQTITSTSQFQTQGKQFFISSIAGQKQMSKPGNVVILNKNPINTISTTTTKTIGQPMTTFKYARLVTTGDGQKIVMTKPGNVVIPTTNVMASSSSSMSSGKKIEIINSSIIKPADTKYQPIIINVDSKGPQIKKVYRNVEPISHPVQVTRQVPGATVSQSSTTGTIVIRPSVTRQPIPQVAPRSKAAILNRGNLTVKRVINVAPGTNVVTTHETVTKKS